jgi:hypothetical protein
MSCQGRLSERNGPRQAGQAPPLQGAEEFVEFVGGVEVGFQVAGG